MSLFLQNIIQRHTKPGNLVMPRLRGIFENENIIVGNPQNDVFTKEEVFNEQAKKADVVSNRDDSVPANVNSQIRDKSNSDFPSRDLQNANHNFEKHDHPGILNPEIPHIHRYDNLVNNVDVLQQNPISNLAFNSESKTPRDHSFRFQKEVVKNDEELQTPLVPTGRVIPASSIMVISDRQAIHEGVKPSTVVNAQSNQPSPETLNWVRSFKHVINNEPGTQNQPQPAPVIKVNIGRIDVRASTQQTPVKSNPEPKRAMTLDDFLEKKNGSR